MPRRHHMTEPELYGDEILPLEDDTIEQQIDGQA